MMTKRPLRKIVDTVTREHINSSGNIRYDHYEILECGHEQLVRTDFYGETNAYRRRCRECEIKKQ